MFQSRQKQEMLSCFTLSDELITGITESYSFEKYKERDYNYNMSESRCEEDYDIDQIAKYIDIDCKNVLRFTQNDTQNDTQNTYIPMEIFIYAIKQFKHPSLHTNSLILKEIHSSEIYEAYIEHNYLSIIELHYMYHEKKGIMTANMYRIAFSQIDSSDESIYELVEVYKSLSDTIKLLITDVVPDVIDENITQNESMIYFLLLCEKPIYTYGPITIAMICRYNRLIHIRNRDALNYHHNIYTPKVPYHEYTNILACINNVSVDVLNLAIMHYNETILFIDKLSDEMIINLLVYAQNYVENKNFQNMDPVIALHLESSIEQNRLMNIIIDNMYRIPIDAMYIIINLTKIINNKEFLKQFILTFPFLYTRKWPKHMFNDLLAESGITYEMFERAIYNSTNEPVYNISLCSEDVYKRCAVKSLNMYMYLFKNRPDLLSEQICYDALKHLHLRLYDIPYEYRSARVCDYAITNVNGNDYLFVPPYLQTRARAILAGIQQNRPLKMLEVKVEDFTNFGRNESCLDILRHELKTSLHPIHAKHVHNMYNLALSK